MRRLVLAAYGNPPTVRWQFLDTPTPRAGEVRVRVHAAGLNPIDAKTARGDLSVLMPKSLPAPIGSDFAGVVDAVGDNVTGLAVGDEVFGMAPGAIGEMLVGPAEAMTIRPTNVSVPTAAVSAMVGLAAATIMRTLPIHVRAGAAALVIGASGGIGRFLLPQLRQRGIRVIATGASVDVDRLRACGASELIDRHADNVTARAHDFQPAGYDLVVDMTNQFDNLLTSAALVRPGGQLISTLFGPELDRFRGNITVTYIRNQSSAEALSQIGRLLADRTAVIAADHIVAAGDAVAGIVAYTTGWLSGKIAVSLV